MKASDKIAAYYKRIIEMHNGIPPKESFAHPTDGRPVDNGVTIPIRLLNELLREKMRGE